MWITYNSRSPSPKIPKTRPPFSYFRTLCKRSRIFEKDHIYHLVQSLWRLQLFSISLATNFKNRQKVWDLLNKVHDIQWKVRVDCIYSFTRFTQKLPGSLRRSMSLSARSVWIVCNHFFIFFRSRNRCARSVWIAYNYRLISKVQDIWKGPCHSLQGP